MPKTLVLVSRRKVEGKEIRAQIIDGIVMCGKCSQPTQHLQAQSGGTAEEFCAKCHISYIPEE